MPPCRAPLCCSSSTGRPPSDASFPLPPHTRAHAHMHATPTLAQDAEVGRVKVMWCEWGNDRSHLEPPAHVSILAEPVLQDDAPSSARPSFMPSFAPPKSIAARKAAQAAAAAPTRYAAPAAPAAPAPAAKPAPVFAPVAPAAAAKAPAAKASAAAPALEEVSHLFTSAGGLGAVLAMNTRHAPVHTRQPARRGRSPRLCVCMHVRALRSFTRVAGRRRRWACRSKATVQPLGSPALTNIRARSACMGHLCIYSRQHPQARPAAKPWRMRWCGSCMHAGSARCPIARLHDSSNLSLTRHVQEGAPGLLQELRLRLRKAEAAMAESADQVRCALRDRACEDGRRAPWGMCHNTRPRCSTSFLYVCHTNMRAHTHKQAHVPSRWPSLHHAPPPPAPGRPRPAGPEAPGQRGAADGRGQQGQGGAGGGAGAAAGHPRGTGRERHDDAAGDIGV